ncbi:glucosaminidase domain-containing protein [Motiliproteus sp. SC1-56]|uniref:glucosaminidase domain-containing protein n=1 Tax=Motiliproteus sp. SC1-56 TaxID=2799565 RepID=UPI001A8FB0E9|nr:glucosaminidase domain-containing protein [Motiliproteus sp. SC1-56]
MRCTFTPLIAALLFLGGCQPSEPVAEKAAEPTLTRAENPPPLNPPLESPPLPDFGAVKDVTTKKAAFFAYMRPLVEQQNRHIEALHEHLEQLSSLHKEQGKLHPEDREWLQGLAERYRVDDAHAPAQLQTLQRKLGPLPPALVLAQAANESAWGTSRFARQGNNLFGQWCFSPGCGLPPLRRSAEDSHEVAAFDSVAEGVHSYFTNLNGNASYAELRAIRRCLNREGQPLEGRALAAGLDHYSARGSHYVKELQAMMRINELEPWARNWWGGSDPSHPCFDLVQVQVEEPDPLKMPEPDPASTSAAVSSTVSAATPSVSSATASSEVSAMAAVTSLAAASPAAPVATEGAAAPATTPAATGSAAIISTAAASLPPMSITTSSAGSPSIPPAAQ